MSQHSIEKIRKAFYSIHSYATKTSTTPYMSIPADAERDADLIVSAAIDELEELRQRVEEVTRNRDELFELSQGHAHTEKLLQERATVLLNEMRAAYEFHKSTECISEGREECSCSMFDGVRDALRCDS